MDKLPKKFISIIVVVVLVIGVLWLGNENKQRSEEVSYTVSVEPVSLTATVSTTTNTNGEVKIKGNKVENVVLDYDAVLKELFVDDGQTVKKGEPLFKIQRYSEEIYKQKLMELENTLTSYEDKLKIANVVNSSEYDIKDNLVNEQISSATAKKKKLESELKTLQDKKEKEEITHKEYSEQKDSYDVAILECKANIQQLKDSLADIKKSKIDNGSNTKLLKDSIKEVKTQIKTLKKSQNITIKASKSGVIFWSQELYAGLLVQQNQSILKILNTSKTDNCYVQVKLVESEYENLTDDSNIYISYGSGLNSEKYKGKLGDEVPRITYTNDIAYYNIRIYFDEKVDLIVDMPVKVQIESKINIQNKDKEENKDNEENNYYILPINAVVSRNEKNAIFLFMKDENKNSYYAKLLYVDIVTSNNDTVIVSSSELDKNSVVITDGNYDLYGGEKVVLDQGQQSGYMDLNLFN